MPTIAVGVHGGDGAARDIPGDGGDAPGIVTVLRDRFPALVDQGDDVPLQVFQEIVRGAVVNDAADTVLVVKEGGQLVVAPSLTQYLSTVQEIVVSNTVDRFTRPDAVSVVGIGVAVKGFQLPAFFPGRQGDGSLVSLLSKY